MLGSIRYRAAVLVRGEGSVYTRLASLQRHEYLPAEAIAARQAQDVARVLRERLPHIPMYAEFSARMREATSNNALELLSELPILEKEVLQADASRLRVQGWRGRTYVKTTGGSTGAPVTVEKNAAAIAQEMAATWLGYGWFGVRIGDRNARFWGQPLRNARRRLRYRAADVAMNRLTLSAFGYSDRELDSYIDRIRRYRPVYLYGYVSALEDIARRVLHTGVEMKALPLKVVITTSEVLSDPQRRLIASAFGVPVQNEYGCGEVGPIAYECPAGSLHLLPTNQFVEVVDDNGKQAPPDQPGSIVLTDLNNEAMPLIRYRIGDTGSLGRACSCGRSMRVLSNVFGREYDFVEAESGLRYHGEFFMYLFEDLRKQHPQLGQFKVIQTGARTLVVHLVVSGNEEGVINSVEEEFQQRLPEFTVLVELRHQIVRQASGKMRVVENHRFSPSSSSCHSE